MLARVLVFGLAWLTLALGRAQSLPPAAAPVVPGERPLDGGLLEPEWFGPGPTWSRNWRVDFFWVKPGVRWEQPTIYLCPWEEPRFLSEREPLDYASGWEAAEFLQDLLQTRLKGMPGIQLATSPGQTPYHAMGRIVEATHIRQGAVATFGVMAGLPSFTWDFKVVDVRTGQALLASHHRSIWAPASTWVTALELPLRQMVGLPPTPPWEVPPDSQKLEDGSWTWAAPGLSLPLGCLGVGNWTAETDTGHLWKVWTNGMGASLAEGIQLSLRERVARSELAIRSEDEPAYLLTGQIFSTPKHLKARYRAVVTKIATGQIVARQEIRSPFGLPNGVLIDVSERIVSHLETLQEGAAKRSVPGPETASLGPQSVPKQTPSAPSSSPPDKPVVDKGGASSARQAIATTWVGLDRLVSVSGPVDKAWVSPTLNLAGRTLQVAAWSEPALRPEADGYDRLTADQISSRAPAWLYGALASHANRGFQIHRQNGDLRLEGRVVHLHQADLSKFGTLLAQAYTFGLATKSIGILQIRVLEVRTGKTLVLVEQELVSFQAASDGVPYKAFKWLAQDLVPWLLKEGRRTEAPIRGPMCVGEKPSPSLPRP